MHPQKGKTLAPDQQAMSDLWDEHMRSEFESSSVEDTLETMVEKPYVNHVPVLTGGVGLDEVREFYADHFITQQPPEVQITPVSRFFRESDEAKPEASVLATMVFQLTA